jgi:hypothetical protein
VVMTLAPTMPPRVQFLNARSTMPPSDELRAKLTSIVALGRTWDAPTAQRLRISDDDVEPVRAKVTALATTWGDCKASDVIAGDGETTTTLKLICDRGIVNARLTIDPQSKNVKSFDLTPSGEKTCVP